MASLHPDHGARIVLERGPLEGEGEPEARYALRVYEPGGVLREAEVRFGADITRGAWSESPPEWIEIFVDRLLKTFAKKHADGSWPRKVTRWRAER